MLELLDPRTGQKILDVGSGSGWTTALLAEIVGDKGRVIALERVKELAEFGRKNVEKYNFIKKGIVEMRLADETIGFSAGSPYDRILVSAFSLDIPNELRKQMKIGGKMVIPVKSSIVYVERKSENDYYEKEYPGFAFVPLVTKEKNNSEE
ncbi:MAG: hypothetical protein A2Z52_02730 [Candidatus Moranbacteria bacterium RBG_19FT_COMBO_42_6]|nr:MAG: hypothetical protein A2Z52_02730 [Candidatus Moranbacteria bacterium RBG_19FT_COMBO_42_6]